MSQSSTSSKTTLHSSDRVSSQPVSTTAAAKTCLEKTSTASSMSYWCFCLTRVNSRSCSWPMETVKLWRSRQEEERKIRTRRTHGKLLLFLTLLMNWTARCAPPADRCWPPKTSTPTSLCTRRKLRSSLHSSQLVASSASLRSFSPDDWVCVVLSESCRCSCGPPEVEAHSESPYRRVNVGTLHWAGLISKCSAFRHIL